MTLYEEIKALWGKKHEECATKWAKALGAGMPAVAAKSDEFHEWKPLRFYVSVTDVTNAAKPKKPVVRFSLRYRGQEIAGVGGSPLTVQVTDDHEKRNAKYFKVKTPAGDTPWADARAFRSLFRSQMPGALVKSEEHELEARILEELEKSRGQDKFDGTLRGVRHCGLTEQEYPLQFPLPISAHSGHPVDNRGNIDILVRRGATAGKPSTHLGVWELKRRGEFADAIAQTYIYAVVLALVLRSPSGPAWWELMGFGRGLPKTLKLEAAVVISADREHAVGKALARLAPLMPLKLDQERTQLSLCAYYYDDLETMAVRRVPLEPAATGRTGLKTRET